MYYAIEAEVAETIHETIEFKGLSGEPWRIVLDEASFHIAARHFVSVARVLPDWRLDDLGFALNNRDRIQTGRTMRPDQCDLADALRQALCDAPVNEDARRKAAYFYGEIGSFG